MQESSLSVKLLCNWKYPSRADSSEIRHWSTTKEESMSISLEAHLSQSEKNSTIYFY